MNLLQITALLTFFTIILLSTGIVVAVNEKNQQVTMRLEKYTRAVGQQPLPGENAVSNKEGKIRSGFKTFSRFLAPRGWISKAELELAQGDVPLRPEEYITLRIILIVFAALFFHFLDYSLLMNSLMIFVAAFIPPLLLKRTKIKRQQKFNNQLGEGLTIMANSLRAGLSFLQAMDTLSKEMPAPLSTEFARLLKEVNLGVPVEAALDNLLARVDSDDLDLLITAVKIQRQVGGNLAEVLDKIGGTIRERIKLKRDLKTLTSQGRISGLIIGLLPFFIVAAIAVINPEYMMILVTHPIGLVLIAVALCSEIIGFLVIKKIVTIDF